MEEVKYIPGDLVMTDGLPIGTKKGVAYVVTASDTNRTLTLKDGTINKGVVTLDAVTKEDKENFVETSTWVKHIVPIPLTPEILEKNGWKRTQIFIDDDGLEFHTYIDDERCLDLQYYPQYKKFAAFICKQEVLSDIEYVHQLQHLLFGLGINHEMEV